MVRIFKNSKEPLFGRADRIMYLKAFYPNVIKEILEDHNRYNRENIFINYLITGGVPRYQEILIKNNVFSEKEIVVERENQVVRRNFYLTLTGRRLLNQKV